MNSNMKMHLKKHQIIFSSFQFSRSVVSDSLRPHELWDTKLSCPSPTPGACSNSCPLSGWCYQTSHSLPLPSLFTFNLYQNQFSSVQFNSVSQSCLTLCDPMNCGMLGFPVHHQLTELAQTHVHQVGDGCHPAISSSVVPFSSHLQSFPASGSFPVSQLFASGDQSIGASASASVLPMNTQTDLL